MKGQRSMGVRNLKGSKNEGKQPGQWLPPFPVNVLYLRYKLFIGPCTPMWNFVLPLLRPRLARLIVLPDSTSSLAMSMVGYITHGVAIPPLLRLTILKMLPRKEMEFKIVRCI